MFLHIFNKALHGTAHSMKFILGLSLLVLAFTMSEPQVVMADGGGEYCKHPEGHDKSKCKKEHRGGEGYGEGHGDKRAGFAKMFEELNLTDDQQASVDRIKSDYKKSSIRLKSDIDVLEVELKDMTNSSRTDLKKVKKKLDNIESKKSELRFMRIEKHIKIKAILDDEQKEKFDAIMDKIGAHRYGGGDGRGEYDKKKCSKKN